MTNRNFRIRTKKIGRSYQIKFANTEDPASFQIPEPKNKNGPTPRHVIMEFQIAGRRKASREKRRNDSNFSVGRGGSACNILRTTPTSQTKVNCRNVGVPKFSFLGRY